MKIDEKTGIENLTMILVDKNYDGKVFKLTDIFFAEDDIEEDEEGNEKEIKKVYGSIKNFSRRLLESLRWELLSLQELQNELSKPFQIRLDTS